MVIGNPDPQNNPGHKFRRYDRNGNYVDVIENLIDADYGNHQTTYIRDQFNRKVVIEYSVMPMEDWIHSPGSGGEDLVTKVKWKTINVNKRYISSEYNPPGSSVDYRNFPLDESFKVVDRIYLPKQYGTPAEDDLYYEFYYNADNSPAADLGWGEVNGVRLPSGAMVEYTYSFDDANGPNRWADWIIGNRIVEKAVKYQETYAEQSTVRSDIYHFETFPQGASGSNITSLSIKGPDGSIYTEFYAGDSFAPTGSIPLHQRGELYKSLSADGTITEKVYSSNIPYNSNFTGSNRFVRYELVSPADSAGNHNITAIREYKY